MGLPTVQRPISEETRVVITGRNRPRLDAATKDLGERAVGIVADAADLADLNALMQAIRQRYGRLDVVFANTRHYLRSDCARRELCERPPTFAVTEMSVTSSS